MAHAALVRSVMRNTSCCVYVLRAGSQLNEVSTGEALKAAAVRGFLIESNAAEVMLCARTPTGWGYPLSELWDSREGCLTAKSAYDAALGSILSALRAEVAALSASGTPLKAVLFEMNRSVNVGDGTDELGDALRDYLGITAEGAAAVHPYYTCPRLTRVAGDNEADV